MPVAFVSHGARHRDAVSKWQHQLWKANRAVVTTDLSETLDNLRDDARVSHLGDGRVDKTVVAIFAQDRFAAHVNRMISTILETCAQSVSDGRSPALIVTCCCPRGIYRADVVGRCLKALSNNIIVGEAHVFKAQFFSLHDASMCEWQRISM